jgi:intermediate filament protein if
MSARTTYQKSAKGPLSIAECSGDGKFIVIENTGRKDEPLSGWTLKRNIDGEEKVDYAIDAEIVVKPVNKVKLWSKGSKPSNSTANDIETDQVNWGSGSNVTTKLINAAGEERATHVQKTTLL